MKIAWNLGLGDAIACAAIVAKLANKNDVVEIPCWKHNEISVKSFFINYANVKIVTFIDVNDYNNWALVADLKIGHYGNSPQLESEDFVQWFYRQAGMDISEKDKYCPILSSSLNIAQQKKLPTEYQFVHHDFLRGFEISQKKLNSQMVAHFAFNESLSILSYMKILIGAKEIHCIDSSFIHLVECLPTTGKLFYHKYARPNSPDYKYIKKEWEILN